MSSARVIILSCALLSLVSGIALATPYALTDLGPISPDTVSLAYASKTVGGTLTVVGQTGSAAASTPVAWTFSGGVATATKLGDSTMVGLTATAIDANGNVAGGKIAASSGIYAYYLPKGGSPSTLPPISNAGSNASVASGMNDAGLIVGQSSSNDSGNYLHASAWTNNGFSWDVADLGGLVSDAVSKAQGVNSNGVVVGYSYSATNTGGNQEAVTWTKSGSTWTIHQLNTTHTSIGYNSAALGINAAGDAVGWGYWAGNVFSTATLFKHDGTLVNLGLGSYMFSYAQSINSSGTVVGYQTTPVGGTGIYHAFVSNGTTGSLQDLNSTALVPNLGTWTLAYAMGIDDQGNIVGRGNPTGSGATHAFLLRPALPGDTNLDGTVDVSDLNKVLTNYDHSGGMTWAQGDINGDGTVDVTDLNKVLTNYDKSLAASSAAGARTAVPEPSAIVLLTAAAVAIFVGLRRR